MNERVTKTFQNLFMNECYKNFSKLELVSMSSTQIHCKSKVEFEWMTTVLKLSWLQIAYFWTLFR